MLKKIKIISLGLISIAFASCDKVDFPHPGNNSGGTGASGERNILLEDYTGHTCGNCAEAAEVAEQLHGIYGNRVITVSIHAGFFAMPQGTKYPDDYRTTVGNDYDGFFGISTAGNPNGMVNRIDFPSTQHVKGHNDWGNVMGSVPTEADVLIELSNVYDAGTRKVSVTSESEFVNALNGEYKLVLLLTEDSIIGKQKDYRQTNADLTDYVHRHMLRTDLNGSWGETLVNGTSSPGTPIVKNHELTLDASWKEDHCSIVAYIYDAATYEVIQVAEEHVK